VWSRREGRDLGDEEGGAVEDVQLGYEEEGVEELGDNRSATVRNLSDPEVLR
jgi:hypothetical protein